MQNVEKSLTPYRVINLWILWTKFRPTYEVQECTFWCWGRSLTTLTFCQLLMNYLPYFDFLYCFIEKYAHPISSKVQIFWECRKNVAHLPLTIWRNLKCQKKRVEDGSNFCGILRIFELYHLPTSYCQRSWRTPPLLEKACKTTLATNVNKLLTVRWVGRHLCSTLYIHLGWT